MTPNEELYDLPTPHKHGTVYVIADGELVADDTTLMTARVLQRFLAKKKIKADVWQGWRIGTEQ